QKNAEKEKAFRDQMTDFGSLGFGEEDPENIPPPKPAGKGSTAGMSAGEMFVKSQEYTTLMASVPHGSFGEKFRVQSSPMHVGSMKTLLTSGNHTVSGGITIDPDHRGLLS